MAAGSSRSARGWTRGALARPNWPRPRRPSEPLLPRFWPVRSSRTRSRAWPGCWDKSRPSSRAVSSGMGWDWARRSSRLRSCSRVLSTTGSGGTGQRAPAGRWWWLLSRSSASGCPSWTGTWTTRPTWTWSCTTGLDALRRVPRARTSCSPPTGRWSRSPLSGVSPSGPGSCWTKGT